MTPEPAREFGLYVHIPFCRVRCAYCAYGVVLRDAASHPAYERALLAELESRSPPGVTYTSILIGGGTPTELDPPALERLLSGIPRRVAVAADAEWAVEANPESLDEVTLDRLERAGVTRLTIGCQSFQDNDLRALGRAHSAEQSRASVTSARSRSFRSVGIDLLARISGQSEACFTGNIRTAIDLGVDHVAVYALSGGEPGATDDEDVSWPLRRTQAQAELAPHGLRSYELTAFARPGHEERHRVARCRGAEYLGIGSHAASHLDGDRSVNVGAVEPYIEAATAGHSVIAERERLPAAEAARERIMLGLHLRAGIAWPVIDAALSPGERAALEARIAVLESDGLLVRSSGRIRLSDAGWDEADSVFADLL